MGIYPASPALSGDTVTVQRFMQNPTLIKRRVDELAAQTFLADFLFTGRELTTGSAIYEVSDGVYLAGDPEIVNPGAEYPRILPTSGAAALAVVRKRGADVPLTDEAVGRSGVNAMEKALRQLTVTIRRDVDDSATIAAATAVTQTQAAKAVWSDLAGRRAWLDIELAKATIEGHKLGYEADTVLVRRSVYPYLAESLLAALPREQTNGTLATGRLPVLNGLTVAPADFPISSGVDVMVVDRKVFGSLAYEKIPSPEYQGDPATGIETWARRDPDANDQWLIRGRRPIVPIVQEPLAAVEITGVA